MIQTIEGRICEVCGVNEAVVVCNGCKKPSAKNVGFDIWGYGCGHGNPMVFCRKCDADPAINIWKAAL